MSILRQPPVLVAMALWMLAPAGCERRDDASRSQSQDNAPTYRSSTPGTAPGSVTAGGSASSQSPANRTEDGTRRSGVLDSPGGARTTAGESGSAPRDATPPLMPPDGKVPATGERTNEGDDRTNKSDDRMNKTDERMNKSDDRMNKTDERTNKTDERTHKTDERTDGSEDRSGKTTPKSGEPPRGSNRPTLPAPPGSR